MNFADLSDLPRRRLPGDTILFRPGDHASAFVLVWQGRIDVRLTGFSGREILLYAVEPGQSCVQTTLGLLGGEAYTGEAITRGEVELSLIPKDHFLQMMETATFRAQVLRAFGQRMADLTRVLEITAFEHIDQRLARALLEMARDGIVEATQTQLAARIGSAREVVSRQLQDFAAKGWTQTARGRVKIVDPAALRALYVTLVTERAAGIG